MIDLGPDEILERTQWDFFWVPDDARAVDRPELAYLASSRDLPMLNTVVRTRAAADALPALVAEVGAVHRRVTSRWNVPPTFDPGPLEAVLAEGGWAPAYTYAGYTLPVDRGSPASAAGVGVERIADEAALEGALAVSAAAFGGDWTLTPAQAARDLAACADPAGRVHRFLARAPDGRPVSTGGLSIFPALSFGFLFGGCTAPDFRGRGAYRAILEARLAVARRLGVARVGLYGREETSGPIVARLGFDRHGPLVQWDRPPPDLPAAGPIV